MKIAIAHSTQENPVTGGGTEEQLTEPIAERAADLLRQLGYDARSDWPHTKVGDVITAVNGWPADLVVDVHTDAYRGESRGTSAFWFPGSAKGEKLARALAARVAAVSGKIRGVYARSNLGILASTTMPAALVELDFHDNPAGAIHIWENRWAFARAVAQAVLDYLGDTRTLPGETNPPTTTTPTPATTLTVDGIIGPQTTKRLQAWLGVTVDGIIGPQTTRALTSPKAIRALQTYLNTQP